MRSHIYREVKKTDISNKKKNKSKIGCLRDNMLIVNSKEEVKEHIFKGCKRKLVIE